MKNGKRPNLRQKKVISAAGLDHEEWLITKNLPDVLHLVNRFTGEEQIIPVA